MRITKLKEVALRRPFRAFGVRLSNGAQYTFKDPRDFGAPRDFHVIVHFGGKQLVIIDTENIVEVFPK